MWTQTCWLVCLPYEFTLLSNRKLVYSDMLVFVYHMNLHYSQTDDKPCYSTCQFVYHMNLHYSQTGRRAVKAPRWFVYHMNLHYSQTGGVLLVKGD